MTFNCLKVTELLWGGSLLFTITFSEIPGTHLIDLGGVKRRVDLGVTQGFWRRDPWIGLALKSLEDDICCFVVKYCWVMVNTVIITVIRILFRLVLFSMFLPLKHNHDLILFTLCWFWLSDGWMVFKRYLKLGKMLFLFLK